MNNIKLYLLSSISLALAFNGNANNLKTDKAKSSLPNIIFFLLMTCDGMLWGVPAMNHQIN